MTIDEFQFSYYLWELAHNIPVKISLMLEISRAMSLKEAWGFKVFPENYPVTTGAKEQQRSYSFEPFREWWKNPCFCIQKTNGLTILSVPDPKDIFVLCTDASFAIVVCVCGCVFVGGGNRKHTRWLLRN